MNPNESPPSFSSGAKRTIDHQAFHDGPNAQPSTDNNQGPSFTSLYPDQGKSVNDPFKGDSYEYGEKAPSVGAMREFIASNPSGGTMYPYSDGQPPSLTDVARRYTSQTGSWFTGYEGSVDPQPRMSLTGKNFNKYDPGAFHKPMREFIASNPFGGTMYPYSDGQPPLLTDVARRDTSQTGSSFTGNEGSVDPQPEMSLTGKNFNKYHPGAFHKAAADLGGMSKKLDWEVDEIIILKEDYDLSQLPHSPRCKNLLKLSIQVSGFTEIPPTFFEHMPLLEELDLSTTNIQSLPSSISSLTLLQKLFMRGCSVLMELPSEIGMLTKLKLLDCEGSEIMYIPKEIGELNDLEVLRVSLSQYADYFLKTKRVNDSVIIPRDILSKLNKLKELCLTTCPEAEWWEKEVREIQDDLCHLEYLETLTWYLPTKMVLDQFLQIKRGGKKVYENLSNFTLTIGRHPQLTSCLPANLEKKFEKFKKCLKWINAEGNEKDISMIMEWAEALFLSRHWTIVRLSDFDLAKLKYCLLAECNEMETLVEVDELSEDGENIGKVGLESIEYLTVHDMEKFQSIWKGPMGKDSLSRLRILALHTCPKLTTIFTINIAQNLSRLTELTVEDCPNVTSLISNESPNIATGPLIPCLEKIFLLDLPELDSISIFKGKIILEKVDSLLVYNCPKLQYLSVMELPNIQKIKGEKEWWNDLKCDKSKWQNVFEQLKEERNLIEQLAEATNSLQHFHDILLCGSRGGGGGGGVQGIPAASRKMVQGLKEIVNGVSDVEIYAALKDCNMDPNEAVNRLLSQDAKDKKPLDRSSLGVSGRSHK